MELSAPPSNWLTRISPCLRSTSIDDSVQSHTAHGPCPRGFSTPLRIIYDHEVILFRDCTCVFEFDDREIVCEPDMFIIIPPGKWHSEVCPKTHRGRRYWCHFDWVFQSLKAESPVMSFSTHRPRYELCRVAPDFVPLSMLYGKIPDPPKAYELGERLAVLAAVGTAHEMLLAGTVLHELLIRLLDAPRGAEESMQPQNRDTSVASRMRRTLDMIALKPDRSVKLSAALSSMGYSYEHLCRVFKRAYGVSPLRYIHAQQMTRAKALLKNSDLPVGEICFAVGMHSPAHFTKMFHALVGKTPLEYRRSN